MPPLKISVSGEATIPRTAERAVLDVKVSSQGTNQKWVSSEATTAARHLQDIFGDLSPSDSSEAANKVAALAHWSMSSMTTTSWYPTDEKGNPSGDKTYTTSLDFEVRVRNFDALGPLATKLSGLPHVKIDNVRWVLTEATQAAHRRQLRKMAAADALQRARDYAETLGLAIVKPVELVGEGMGNVYSGRRMIQTARKRKGTDGYNDDGDLETSYADVMFQPEELHISSRVECKFLAGNSEEDFVTERE
ncbi:hypothetical protein H2203_005313 [Taxawa tesnikishii (nom. ined.)]|nr:hypothetical protein H2203_005313 [Dothideales sp. JES 119]